MGENELLKNFQIYSSLHIKLQNAYMLQQLLLPAVTWAVQSLLTLWGVALALQRASPEKDRKNLLL